MSQNVIVASKPSRCCQIIIPLMFCAALLNACGSGGSASAPPDIVVDDSRDTDEVVSGLFTASGDAIQLQFQMDEDGVLDGFFALPAGESTPPVGDQGQSLVTGGFTIQSLPSSGRLTLRSEGAVFHYEPDQDFSGVDSFVYATDDGRDIQVVIDVEPVPDAPVLNPDILAVADQGRLFSAALEVTDPDSDQLRFSASELPDWLGLDARTGVLSGIPQQSDVGTFADIRLTVTDDSGLSDSIDEFELVVVDINDPPTLNTTQVPEKLYGRETVRFSVFPEDLDDDSVSIRLESNPAFDSTVSNGRIELRVKDIVQKQSIPLVIIARDERGAVTREAITVQLFPRTESGKGITVSGYREGRGVHIVILGDGYASDQQDAFREHVDGILDNIRSDEGIASHLGAFNIHMIETVSKQSGADDSDQKDTVNTAFNSSYNCKSVPRLVCADVLKLYEASLSEYPSVEQIILLVNDVRFGGSGNSGGRVAITSAYYPEIALHEMGHSLADLADEYVDPLILETSGLPAFEEGRYQNVSTLDDPVLVPWSHWIDPTSPLPQFAGDSGVGIFQGGLYRSTGVYRGTFDSRMRSYEQPFGPVNTEQWILRLYTLTEGVRNLSPRVSEMQIGPGEFKGFSVDPMFGSEVQEIVWTLNGDPLLPTGNSSSFVFAGVPDDVFDDISEPLTDAIELSGGGATEALSSVTQSRLALSLPAGQHQLDLRVADISGRIRVDPPHAGIFTWRWRINVL